MNNSSNSKQFNPTQGNMKKTGGNYKDNETGSMNMMGTKDLGMNSSNSASLKGKLGSLEEAINDCSNEINVHKNDVNNVHTEKDAIQEIMKTKTHELRSTLMQELEKMDDEMKRHFNSQKSENIKLQMQIATIKNEKVALQNQLIALQRRMSEIEMQVGNDDVKYA